MAQEIEVTIGPEGKVELRVKGVRGRGCLKLTEEIESVLGSVEDRSFGHEYFEIPVRGAMRSLLLRK